MSIVVIAERIGDEITPVTYETVSCAVELAQAINGTVTIVVAGGSSSRPARILAEDTGLPVIDIQGDGLDLFNAEAYASAILDVLGDAPPRFVCLPHTAAAGYELAPLLALGLDAACVTGVEAFLPEAGNLTFDRSQWGGKIVAVVSTLTERAVLSILPGAWPAITGKADTPGPVDRVPFHHVPTGTRTVSIREAGYAGLELGKADVIVSAGKGVGTAENVPLIYEMSSVFPKSAVGASRAACDAGLFDYGHQIGMTGKTVSPKLYIACGISGSSQHIAGMKGSQLVVAVNTDPSAPIFGVSDYCIVEDLTQFIPTFVKAVHSRK